MNFVIPNFSPAQPEIFVLVLALAILAISPFLKKDHIFTYALTQFTLVGAAWLTATTFEPSVTHTFSNMFVDDVMSDVLKMATYITVSATLVYSREYLMLRGLYRDEFFVLVLFATLGIMVMISASHFISLYLGLELLSLSLYALVAMQRDSTQATEAAMKYFVLGAIASALLLYGMSMLYGATGSLELGKVAAAVQHGIGGNTVLVFGLVFIVVGLGFKLGAVPFHMWIPDVYHGAPTAVTLFISTAPKIAAFAIVIRLLAEGLHGLVADWQGMLIILTVASIALGNIVAIAQANIKRMLAYSAISHAGFLLLGILAGSLNGYSSAMFYILVYALMSLGAFGMILLLSREGFEADTINDFKGLNQRSPWYAFMMLLLMLSMAGIPPLAGFYAKLAVLQAAFQAGFVKVVVFAVVLSVVGAFYYLRIIKLMYFDAPESHAPITAGPDTALLISINGLSVLLIGLLPNALLSICDVSVQQSLMLP
ncbi:MAG: NADH-quinone oxidoreductase subunit NuoN [Halothiobacillaceae bacterium]|nr:NADH-quinone oxidoreductase subunit NuoN [Halothiobacillaceae bacterium]